LGGGQARGERVRGAEVPVRLVAVGCNRLIRSVVAGSDAPMTIRSGCGKSRTAVPPR
jgi:hypothetical protein